MKYYLLTSSLILFAYLNCTAQTSPIQQVSAYDWSNPTVYENSQPPLITGFGLKSDSLSSKYDGIDFYVHENKYYSIQSWADYYLWFTQRFWYQFQMPDLYKYYYDTNDNIRMAQFIAGNFKGNFYPSRFILEFGNAPVGTNLLADNDRLALNSKQHVQLERQLSSRENNDRPSHFISGDSHVPNYARRTSTTERYIQLNGNGSTNSSGASGAMFSGSGASSGSGSPSSRSLSGVK